MGVDAHRRINDCQHDCHEWTHRPESIGPPLEAQPKLCGGPDVDHGHANVENQEFGQELPDRSQVVLADHTADGRPNEQPREESNGQLHILEPSVLNLLGPLR